MGVIVYISAYHLSALPLKAHALINQILWYAPVVLDALHIPTGDLTRIHPVCFMSVDTFPENKTTCVFIASV